MYEVQGTLTCPPTPPHPNPKTKSNTQKGSKMHVRFSCRRHIHDIPIYSIFSSTGEAAIFCHRLSGGMPVNDAGWQWQCLVKHWHVKGVCLVHQSACWTSHARSCKDRSLLGHLFVFWLLWAFGCQCSWRLVSRERLSSGVGSWM